MSSLVDCARDVATQADWRLGQVTETDRGADWWRGRKRQCGSGRSRATMRRKGRGTRHEGKRRSEEAEDAEEGAEEGEAIPNAGSSTWSRGLKGLDRGRAARPSRCSGSGSTRLGTDPGGRGEEFWAESPRGFETRPDGNGSGKRGGCWLSLVDSWW